MVGFQKYVQSDIELTINQSGRADAVLRAGAATETVTVQGENTLINYDDGTLQGGIDPQTVKDLPLIVSGKPRSSASFAVLLPGVSSGSSNEAFNARINGGIQSGDEALLDGATMQEGFMSRAAWSRSRATFRCLRHGAGSLRWLPSRSPPPSSSSSPSHASLLPLSPSLRAPPAFSSSLLPLFSLPPRLSSLL
jgi:hypothetical protein